MILKKIRWKNFLSYGKKMTELNLDQNKTINIQGLNGHGKSVFIDVLHYALADKPFRKIKMGEIPNAINKKNCYVELEVSHGDKEIIIKRGINPKIFEIFINGKRLDEFSKATDQQQYLEQLLNFNSKTLRYTIIMSSMNYSPFLKMAAAEKRLFIDDILNMSDFTNLSVFVKKKFSIFKTKITDVEFEIKALEDKIAQMDEQNSRVIKNSDKQIGMVQENIDKINKDIEELLLEDFSNIDNIVAELEKLYKKRKEAINEVNIFYKSKFNDVKAEFDNSKELLETKNNNILKKEETKYKLKLDGYNKKSTKQKEKLTILKKELNIQSNNYHTLLRDFNSELSTIEANILTESKQKNFLDNNAECPTCRGNIDDKFKNKAFKKLDETISIYTDQKDLISKKIKNLQSLKASNDIIKTEIDTLSEKIDEFNNNVSNFKLKYTKYKGKIVKNNQDKINDLNTKRNEEEKILTNKQNIEIDNIKEKTNDKIQELQNEVTELKAAQDNNKKMVKDKKDQITKYEQQMHELKNPEVSSVSDTTPFLHKLNNSRKKLEKYVKEKNIFETSIKLLSDKGFKTFIINKYIPVLNKYVNEYLDILEAHYRLKFDSGLNETIVARGYEKLSYESFSSGEKARCDLALLFGLIELSKRKNSLDCNLLVFDEILDTSLDKNGVYGVLNIISRLKNKGYTIYTISHREELKDQFDLTILAQKKLFSELEEQK